MSAQAPAVPRLRFAVESAGGAEYAAVPTIGFDLRIDAGGTDVRSIALDTQIRIQAARRPYAGDERNLLAEIFGEPNGWTTNLRSLLWTHVAKVVPPFSGATTVQLPVVCTYDFDVIAAKYFDALGDGDVPLSFLFSGTVFFEEDGRLRVERISWDCETDYCMPVRVWRETMQRYFPGSAWIRVDHDVFDRLRAFKAATAELTWSSALDHLLRDHD